MTENVIKGICNGGQVTFGYKINAEHHYEEDELSVEDQEAFISDEPPIATATAEKWIKISHSH